MGSRRSDHRYDDVDAVYFAADASREGEVTQLDPGPMGLRGRSWALPDIRILAWQYGPRLLGREVRRDGNLCIFLRLDEGAPGKLNGMDVPATSMILRASHRESEFITATGCRMLEIDVAPRLVEALGWSDDPGGARRADPRHIAGLRDEAMRVVSVLERLPHLSPDVLTVLQQGLIPRIDVCLGGASAMVAASGTGQLVQEATARMRRRPPAERLHVGALAHELQVPERTLYQAFRSWVGVGPYQLDVLMRLHRFRRDLVASSPLRHPIGHLAQVHGFPDHSRMSQLYRRHFGETPRATRARRAQALERRARTAKSSG